jgi:hypothetical protein
MFSIRRMMRTVNVAAAVATIAVLSLGAFATSAQATSDTKPAITKVAAGAQAVPATVHGCPLEYVCLYPQNAGWNGDRPSFQWAAYGAHNLSNQFGTHYILNNQTGSATFALCTGYNGGGTCSGPWFPGEAVSANFTPINSVYLAPF